VVATGLEKSQDSSGNPAFPDQSCAESGADFADSGEFDPHLARLIEAWPRLSDATRDSLMAIVEEATSTAE
jgi:hypothetical protein